MKICLAILALLFITPAFAEALPGALSSEPGVFVLAQAPSVQQAAVPTDAELYELWQSCIQYQKPVPPPAPPKMSDAGKGQQPSVTGRGPQPTEFLPGWESCAAVRDERAKRASAGAEQSRKKKLEDAVQRLSLPKQEAKP